MNPVTASECFPHGPSINRIVAAVPPHFSHESDNSFAVICISVCSVPRFRCLAGGHWWHRAGGRSIRGWQPRTPGDAISQCPGDLFTYQGAQSEVRGGSYGRVGFSAQARGQSDGIAAYVSADALDDRGWRHDSPSRVRRRYGDIVWNRCKPRCAGHSKS
jgi:hypothetical protein